MPPRSGTSSERRPGGRAKPRRSPAVPPSIAVMPFRNLSGDPEQDYFADGMVEDIITGLSRIKWLFVIARNSSLSKGRAVDVKRVGRELGVRYVLEAASARRTSRVRIAAQLVEAETGVTFGRTATTALSTTSSPTGRGPDSVVGAIEPSGGAGGNRARSVKARAISTPTISFCAPFLVYVGHAGGGGQARCRCSSGRWRWKPTTPAPMACSPVRNHCSFSSTRPLQGDRAPSRPFSHALAHVPPHGRDDAAADGPGRVRHRSWWSMCAAAVKHSSGRLRWRSPLARLRALSLATFSWPGTERRSGRSS